MKVDLYGKKTIELVCKGNQWQAYICSEGKKRPIHDLAIPSGLTETEVVKYLDDIYHELASPAFPKPLVLSERK